MERRLTLLGGTNLDEELHAFRPRLGQPAIQQDIELVPEGVSGNRFFMCLRLNTRVLSNAAFIENLVGNFVGNFPSIRVV